MLSSLPLLPWQALSSCFQTLWVIWLLLRIEYLIMAIEMAKSRCWVLFSKCSTMRIFSQRRLNYLQFMAMLIILHLCLGWRIIKLYVSYVIITLILCFKVYSSLLILKSIRILSFVTIFPSQRCSVLFTARAYLSSRY
jgi:hypothetical protein